MNDKQGLDVMASFKKGWLIVFVPSFFLGVGVDTNSRAQTLNVSKLKTFVGPTPLSIDAADFNNDGVSDVVTCGRTSAGKGVATVFVSDGINGLGAGINIDCEKDPISVKTAFIDNDANIDFAVLNAGSRNVSVFLGDGKGSFSRKSRVKVADNPTAFALGDFDGDSRTDMVVSFSEETSQLGFYVGNGGGKFKESTLTALDGIVREISAGGFGEDAPDDMVIIYTNRNQIELFTGAPDGNFLATRFGMNTKPQIAKLGDVNGDGRADAVVLRASEDSVHVILTEGDGLRGRTVGFSIDPVVEGLAVGDFTGDGLVDFATCHLNSHVVIYRNDSAVDLTETGTETLKCMIVYEASEAAPLIEVGVLPSMASVSLSVLDAGSAVVRRFLDIQSDLGEWVFSVEWNGTNDDEKVVDDGNYYFNYRLGNLLCYRPFKFKL